MMYSAIHDSVSNYKKLKKGMRVEQQSGRLVGLDQQRFAQ